MTPHSIVGLLAEPARLRTFSAVVLGSSTPSAIARAAGLSSKETAAALRRLHEGGLVEYLDGAVRARPDHLKEVVRTAAAAEASGSPGVDHGTGDTRLEALLRTFLREDGEGLRALPRQFGRRREVLRHVAERSFRAGAAYSEREVNEILRGWCTGASVDHVTVRRYLVDHGVMRRKDGGDYWLREEPEAA
ncbi:DUF2087 domain-containing protein [Streptomyces sp. TR06-5]|uniref:DUF2087 domain-containing protein n=1 Tax=unclassified Streptomyces TaxID=2593676 RepID=UPI00399F926A